MKHIAKKDCRFLVYNAAYGPVMPFLNNSESDLDLYLSVNNRTLLMLVYKFIRRTTVSRKGILFISSLAGLRGTQLVIPYAATKAFIWNLAEGLHYEFMDKNLDVSVVCAGTVDTPNFRSSRPKLTSLTPAPMPPLAVSEEALKKFGRRLIIIPGFANKFAVFLFERILPRSIASKIHNDTMGKIYRKRMP
jgi:short-subunit dehydrogenase